VEITKPSNGRAVDVVGELTVMVRDDKFSAAASAGTISSTPNSSGQASLERS
jgi:hypothetical protein